MLLRALRTVDETDYVVERELARGGMGRILLATDRQVRAVAIKVLLGSSERGLRRFLREMQITARLQHPSIVTLYEAGRWPSGEPFFAMKLVQGRSLREELAARTALTDRLALLPRLISVTDALAYAHEQGIIHRDLKPGTSWSARSGRDAAPRQERVRSGSARMVGPALSRPGWSRVQRSDGRLSSKVSVDARESVRRFPAAPLAESASPSYS